MGQCLIIISKIQPLKIVSEYDQEITQSQTADNPMAQLSLPHQDDEKLEWT